MNIRWQRGLAVSLALSVLAVLLVIIFTFDEQTIDNLGYIEPRFLLLAALMLLAAVAVEGYRIALIARAMGGQLTWARGCSIFLTTHFAAQITPMGMAELPALTWYYNQAGINVGLALAAAIVRSFITKLVFLTGIIYLFGIARGRVQFGPVTGDIFSLMTLAFVATVVLNALYVLFPSFVLGLWQRLPRKWREGRLAGIQKRLDLEAREFDRGLGWLWRKRPLVLLPIGLLSLLYWTLFFGILPVIARGLNLQVEPLALVSRQFVLTLALPFIPLPGGSGALELAMMGVYQGIIPRSLIGIFVVVWRIFSYYAFLLLGGGATLGRLWRKGKEKAE